MTQEQQTHKCQTCGSFLLGCTLAEHQAGYCPRILLSGKPTPPATPQPETPLADVPHEEVDELVATIYAERRALSPPPDVERLKAYKRGFRDGFAAAQSWGCDMVEEALAAWSPSTPGEPT